MEPNPTIPGPQGPLTPGSGTVDCAVPAEPVDAVDESGDDEEDE